MAAQSAMVTFVIGVWTAGMHGRWAAEGGQGANLARDAAHHRPRDESAPHTNTCLHTLPLGRHSYAPAVILRRHMPVAMLHPTIGLLCVPDPCPCLAPSCQVLCAPAPPCRQLPQEEVGRAGKLLCFMLAARGVQRSCDLLTLTVHLQVRPLPAAAPQEEAEGAEGCQMLCGHAVRPLG